jgi:hypothetical protein
MNLYGRQGDLVIERLDVELTDELVTQRDVVFAGDSSGHRHRLLGEALVAATAQGRTTRFKLKAPTELIHEKADGHESMAMEAGDYEIRPLRERGGAADHAVED